MRFPRQARGQTNRHDRPTDSQMLTILRSASEGGEMIAQKHAALSLRQPYGCQPSGFDPKSQRFGLKSRAPGLVLKSPGKNAHCSKKCFQFSFYILGNWVIQNLTRFNSGIFFIKLIHGYTAAMSHRDRTQFITQIASIFWGLIRRYKNVHTACAFCHYECEIAKPGMPRAKSNAGPLTVNSSGSLHCPHSHTVSDASVTGTESEN